MDLTRIYTMLDGAQERRMSFADLFSAYPYVIVYFYPKDSTPGCTLEAQDFTRFHREFISLGVGIFGVSRDSMESHARFSHTCNLGIPLISDNDGYLHRDFDVIGTRKLYGVERTGVIRSTFLIDTHGNIISEWRNIKATGHAEKVLVTIRDLIKR